MNKLLAQTLKEADDKYQDNIKQVFVDEFVKKNPDTDIIIGKFWAYTGLHILNRFLDIKMHELMFEQENL